jgi:hypothetical protein
MTIHGNHQEAAWAHNPNWYQSRCGTSTGSILLLPAPLQTCKHCKTPHRKTGDPLKSQGNCLFDSNSIRVNMQGREWHHSCTWHCQLGPADHTVLAGLLEAVAMHGAETDCFLPYDFQYPPTQNGGSKCWHVSAVLIQHTHCCCLAWAPFRCCCHYSTCTRPPNRGTHAAHGGDQC